MTICLVYADDNILVGNVITIKKNTALLTGW